jgi:hypothetical protein
MNREKCVATIAVLLCFIAALQTGCTHHKKSGVMPPAPDWDIWNEPGLVLALDETDPEGDDLGYGSSADLSLMQGTYDANYVYIYIDVYSALIDQTGCVLYNVCIDSNGNWSLDSGDCILC